MSTRQDSAPSPPVGSFDDLVAWIAAGSKPKERWRIGTEHEKFLFHTDSLGPVPYAGPRGVRSLMEGLIGRYGWVPIMEGENIIPTHHEKIMVLKGIDCDLKLLNGKIEELADLATEQHGNQIKSKLQEIVPEYKIMKYE